MKTSVLFLLLTFFSNLSFSQDEFLVLVNKKLDENERIIKVLRSENDKLKSKLSSLLAKNNLNDKKLLKTLKQLGNTQLLLKQREEKITQLLKSLNEKEKTNKELKATILRLTSQLDDLKKYNDKNDEFLTDVTEVIKIENNEASPPETDSGSINDQSLISLPPGEENKTSEEEISALEALELKRKIAEAEREAENIRSELKEITRRSLAERQWRTAIDAKARQGNYANFAIENNCNHTIYVALCYYDLQNNWITEGWWEIEVYRTINPNAYTNANTIYVYARTKEDELVWKGDNKTGSVNKYIASGRFICLKENDSMTGYDNVKVVPFIKVYIGDYTTFTYTLNCD